MSFSCFRSGLFRLLLLLFLGANLVASTPCDELAGLIVLRLQISKEVAWSKFCQGKKVADPAREAVMLTTLKQKGAALGVSPERVTALFLPEIVASRQVQEELVSGWRMGFPRPKDPPNDLSADIRPRLDALNLTMLKLWSGIPNSSLVGSYQEDAERRIFAAGFSKDVARVAARPFTSSQEN
jgi:chorismate mutase-like protein